MSVLIKGMEMPTSCEKCPFLDYEEGFCFATGVKGEGGWYESKLCPGGIKEGIHADCPIIPVPPHGRLIDADALHYSRVQIVHPGGNVGGYNAVVMSAEIKDAPTIIPASEEGE